MKGTLLLSFVIISGALYSPSVAQITYIDFDSLSTGMTSIGARVLSLYTNDTVPGASLFAGGHFAMAGRSTAVNIAEWRDTSNYYNWNASPNGEWFPLGTGADNDVCALTMWNNYLYAGGKFDTAGGIAASHIARWDTAAHKWDSLAGQLNGNVYALCVYHNTLYAGGDFTMANGNVVNRIAMWTDSTWVNAGLGFDTGAVYALTVSNDTLYAGGSFIKSGATTLNHIAKLSGSLWKPVGSGTNNTVYALADWNQLFLYVGGAFTQSGGKHTNYVSSFDSYSRYTWDSVTDANGNGVNDTVRALSGGNYPVALIKEPSQYMSNLLLIGGNFDSAWGRPDKYFAEYYPWDSTSRLSGPVYAIASQMMYANYVGGSFANVQNEAPPPMQQTLNNVAILSFYGPSGVENLTNNSNIFVYPNPSNGLFQLEIKNEELGINNTIEIYNMLGEKVYDEALKQVQGDNRIDLSSQANGIYLYRVITNSGELIGEGKIVVQK